MLPGAAEARAVFAAAHADEPFMRLPPPGMRPSAARVLRSDSVRMRVAVAPGSRRLIRVSARDDVTKGTAGGAAQRRNVALGLPEHLALPVIGGAR